jgi:acetylornithine deacetylase
MAGRMTPLRDVRELLEALVEVDSVNPTLVPGGAGEAEIAAFVARWLERAGVRVETVESDPGRPSVVATVPGRDDGRSLLLNAHLDTVAVAGPDAGLVPRVEDGRLFGRGAYDMKGGLAAIMLVAADVARRPLSGDLIVTAVADEEAASIGTQEVLRSVAADAAIVAEPTELRLAVAHKGFASFEIETHGRAAHGSRYELGVDAIAMMGRVLVALSALDESLRADRDPHALLGGASLHASVIEGGEGFSTYPARCVLTLERRTLPGESREEVAREVRETTAGVDATVRQLFAREPLETPPAEEIVGVLQAAASAVLGQEPEIVGVPFWTDAALIAAAGIPAVVFGPGGEGAHAEAEWVSLDDVERCIRILKESAARFCV